MPLDPAKVKDSVEGSTSPYAGTSKDQDNTPHSTLLHRRLGDGKTFELLPGSNLYATPWDVSTPEVGHEFIRGPLLPSKGSESRDQSEDERPLLDPTTPDSAKKVRFSQHLSGSTVNENDTIFDEFGIPPDSANSRTEFIRPPNTRSVLKNRKGSVWIPDSHPWWPNYEAIHWPPLIFLSIIVLLTYPLLVLASLIAHNRSLFWTRFLVGVATSVLGFLLGLALMEVGKRILEAATWATIIHHSMFEGRSGITLRDLEAKSDQTRFTWLGFSLLYDRFSHPATRRKYRLYDKRRWSFFVIFFIIISLIATSISFLLGRLVNITTTEVHQTQSYKEISLMGDLSADDIAQAGEQLNATESFIQTWTLSPYGSGGQIPQPVKLQWQGQDVFFAELSEQVLAGGLGLGTFQANSRASTNSNMSQNPGILSSSQSNNGVFPAGAVLRLSRWGLRISCAKLPNAQINIVPLSPNNNTYAYVPRDVVYNLFSQLGLQDAPLSPNRPFLQGNDKIPADINMDDIGWVGVWWNNGVAQSFSSHPIDMGQNGTGWIELDLVILRLNTTYTPYGDFPTHSEDRQIGYDAAVCIETIEPWLVDAYNATTGRAATFNIVGRGGLSSFQIEQGKRSGPPVRRSLNSTLNSAGKFPVFALAHDNSRNQILKDNGRDFSWVPNPTAISWTDGSGPKNYTTLSAEFLASSLGKADAAQMLPYLSGSQPILAYQYQDKTLASASVLVGPTIVTCVVILFLGFAAAFLVPRLPLGIPRRDFGLFTWLAAFEGDDLLHQAVKQGVERNMDLEELKRRYGLQKVRYGS